MPYAAERDAVYGKFCYYDFFWSKNGKVPQHYLDSLGKLCKIVYDIKMYDKVIGKEYKK